MQITRTTLIKKIMMAVTGLFLAFFLIIHLLGNLQLLLPEDVGHTQFNAYSHFLSGNLLIKVVSYVLYFSILYHILQAITITIANRRANGIGYHVDNRTEVSGFFSRNMGVLGTLILIFLVIHFKDYWYVYKFGAPPLDSEGNKDLYLIVVNSFKVWWYVLLYAISMVILGFHLIHGVASAFRTLGVYHPKYIKWIKYLGYGFTIALTMGFFIIPIIVYIKQL